MRDLAGLVALVTGGGRRLGKAFVEGLAGQGMGLAIHHGNSRDEAEALVATLGEQGVQARAFGADLTDPDAAMALPHAVAEYFGRLDVLVNSAAVMERIPLNAVLPAEWDSIMNLNLRAPFILAQQSIPYLRHNGGTIVNIADLAAYEPWVDYPVHSISKAGVLMLTKLLAKYAAPEVTVNGIAPGTVLLPEGTDDDHRRFLAETTPLNRLGSPEDAVQALLYLIRHGEFITGETIIVDGGRNLRR